MTHLVEFVLRFLNGVVELEIERRILCRKETLDDAVQTAAGKPIELTDKRLGRGEHVGRNPAEKQTRDAQTVYADDEPLIFIVQKFKVRLGI